MPATRTATTVRNRRDGGTLSGRALLPRSHCAYRHASPLVMGGQPHHCFGHAHSPGQTAVSLLLHAPQEQPVLVCLMTMAKTMPAPPKAQLLMLAQACLPPPYLRLCCHSCWYNRMDFIVMVPHIHHHALHTALHTLHALHLPCLTIRCCTTVQSHACLLSPCPPFLYAHCAGSPPNLTLQPATTTSSCTHHFHTHTHTLHTCLN